MYNHTTAVDINCAEEVKPEGAIVEAFRSVEHFLSILHNEMLETHYKTSNLVEALQPVLSASIYPELGPGPQKPEETAGSNFPGASPFALQLHHIASRIQSELEQLSDLQRRIDMTKAASQL